MRLLLIVLSLVITQASLLNARSSRRKTNPLTLCWQTPVPSEDLFSQLSMPAGFGKTHFVVGWPTTAPAVEPTKKSGCPAQLSSLICSKDGKIKQAFFAPDDNIQDILINLIAHEKKSIFIAVFSFTNQDIARALIEAHKRGVQIMVVVDPSCMQDRFNKIDLLRKAGITVFVYTQAKRGIMIDKMHHKFVIFSCNLFDRSLIVTGSFNYSKSAAFSNQENVVILEEKRIVKRFTNQFEQLCKRSSKLRRAVA